MNQYNTRTTHSNSYYLGVIETLLAGVAANQADGDIANRLNSSSIRSATGATWTSMAVTQALFKLRHYRQRASKLHAAVLQLCFDGVVTKAQVLPLYQVRDNAKHIM